MGLGKVTFSGKGPIRVDMSSLWQNILICMDISYFHYHFHSTASYFLKMSILISLVGILTQARMGVGRFTFLSKGPMRGQYVFLTAKNMLFMDFFLFQLLFPQTQSLIALKWLCLLLGRYPDSNQNGWLSIVRDIWGTDMSCLWQSYKIPGFLP